MIQAIVRVALPLVVLAGGAAGAMLLIRSRTNEDTRVPLVPPPLVRVLVAEPTDLELRIAAQGTVRPSTETELYSEVSGQIVHTMPALENGAFFAAGETLVEIDKRDFELAVARAKSRQAEAELALSLEQAEARSALEEWKDLGAGKEPSALVLREPQLKLARANVEAAAAEVARAKRDLEKTTVKAPYAGRVRAKFVDRGQFVNVGSRLAQIYAVEFAEVRLPLHDEDLAFVDIPLHDPESRPDSAAKPRVELRAHFAGREHVWQGTIERTEGELDPKSRMVHAIARVADPYDPGPDGRPPLLVGMFVRAELIGRRVEGVIVIPRTALLEGDRVLLVDDDDRLRFREVSVLRKERNRAILHSGLASGERLCLTRLDAVSDGMQVRVADDSPGAARSGGQK